MTITFAGFDGTVDESSFATLMRMAGVKSSVTTTAAFAATPIAGTRQISLAPGVAYSAGVVCTSDAPIVVTIPTPTASGWFLLALRRDWAANTVTPVVLPGDTSTSSTPTTVPSNLPTKYSDDPGILADQELYWAFATLNSTTVTLVDVRKLPLGVPKSGSSSLRDAYYGVPATFAARKQLDGAEWWNTDMKWQERFFAEYDAATNPNGTKVWGFFPVAGQLPTARLSRRGSYKSGASNAGGTNIPFDTWDRRSPAALFNGGGASPLSPTRSGEYEIKFGVAYGPHADTLRRQGRLIINDKNVITIGSSGTTTVGQGAGVAGSWRASLSAGDRVQLQWAQGSGVTLEIGTVGTFLELNYVGPPLNYPSAVDPPDNL